MRHRKLDDRTVPSKMGLLTELYLSIFVLFFRIGVLAPPRSKGNASGALGVSLVEMFLAFSAISWIQVITGERDIIGKYLGLFAIAWLALYFINAYFLVNRGSGVAFEKQFKHFSKGKRIALLSAAASIFLASVLVMFLSITAYQKAFNIHPSTGL